MSVARKAASEGGDRQETCSGKGNIGIQRNQLILRPDIQGTVPGKCKKVLGAVYLNGFRIYRQICGFFLLGKGRERAAKKNTYYKNERKQLTLHR